jgi:hypothetical protein
MEIWLLILCCDCDGTYTVVTACCTAWCYSMFTLELSLYSDQAVAWVVQGLNYSQWQGIFSFPKTSGPAVWPIQPAFHWVLGLLLRGEMAGWGMNFTAHLHLALRLMSGAVPLLPIHAMVACCRDNFTFLLYVYITCCHSLSTSSYLKVQRLYVL